MDQLSSSHSAHTLGMDRRPTSGGGNLETGRRVLNLDWRFRARGKCFRRFNRLGVWPFPDTPSSNDGSSIGRYNTRRTRAPRVSSSVSRGRVRVSRPCRRSRFSSGFRRGAAGVIGRRCPANRGPSRSSSRPYFHLSIGVLGDPVAGLGRPIAERFVPRAVSAVDTRRLD